MAVRCNVIGEGLVRTAGSFLDGSSDFTIMFKARINSRLASPSDYRQFWLLGDGNIATSYIAIYDGEDSVGLEADNGIGTYVSQYSSAGFLVPIWYDFLIIYDNTANTLSFYINGWLLGALGIELNAAAFAAERLGYNLIGDEESDLDIEYYRSWNTILTEAEYELERCSTAAVKATNLFCDTPLVSDLLDDSGNGRDWTAVGSTSFVTGATLEDGAPTNIDATLATPLVPGVTIFKNAVDAGVNPPLWYSYTPVDDETLVALMAIGQQGVSATNYNAKIDVFTGPASAPVTWFSISSTNKSVMPHVIPGTLFLFRITAPTATITPATLTLYFEIGPNEPLPAGTLLVPFDLPTLGRPGVAIGRGGTGVSNVLGVRFPLAAGEAGDCLDLNGNMLISDGPTTKLYDSDFNLLATLVMNTNGTKDLIRAHQPNGKFYAMTNAAPPVPTHKISEAGAIEQTWNVTISAPPIVIQCIAPSMDETILYFSGNPGAIRRWDLAGSVILSNLVAAPVGHTCGSLLILADDAILAFWQPTVHTVPPTSFVRRYDSSGATIQTYSIEGNSDRLASEPNSFTSFWVWSKTENAGGLFQHIRLSDGVVLERIDTKEFGSFRPGEAETPTLGALYGNEESCPFFLLRVATGPEPPVPPVEVLELSGLYYIEKRKKDDTLWIDPVNGLTQARKIP